MMTLKEAVKILNTHEHRGGTEWAVFGAQVTGPKAARVVGNQMEDNFTPFEAIAIAEKYMRGHTPEGAMEQVARELHIH